MTAFAVATALLAHPLSPLSVAITPRDDSTFTLRFQRSEAVAPLVSVDIPAGCTAGPPARAESGDQLIDERVMACPGGLDGVSIHIAGLVEAGLPALVMVVRPGGSVVQGLLSPTNTAWVIPEAPSGATVLTDGLALGVGHLLTGLDHVLFVLGLLMLVPGLRARVITLTAFTVGHSLTLSLAVLTSWTPPPGPVEVGIALSLVVVALEIVQPAARPPRWPALLAGAFGLLHGLGFIGALRDVGLPASHLPLSLLGFNLGVEVGQLVVVIAAVPLAWALGRLKRAGNLRLLAGYGMGSLSAMWCLERALLLF